MEDQAPEQQAPPEAPQEPKRDEAQEYKAMVQRVQADFENYKRRAEKEMADAKEITRISTIRKLLPLLDSFEAALSAIHASKAAQETPQQAAMRKGFELTYAQLHSFLKGEGVSPIDSLGKQADPYVHDVLLQGESEKKEGTIIEELQKGYRMGKTIIRHAKVKTSNGVKPNEPDHQ